MQLYWDKNGNLEQIQPSQGTPRYHLWNDDNQLIASIGPSTCGYYGYAADGNRAYKMIGVCSAGSVNNGTILGNIPLQPQEKANKDRK